MYSHYSERVRALEHHLKKREEWHRKNTQSTAVVWFLIGLVMGVVLF